MRFRLYLQNTRPQTIPINYQYPLSAWIYKVFNRANADFARWLHEHGYQFNGNRRYKLFTFSQLQIPHVKLIKDKAQLKVISNECQLALSFSMEEAASTFIEGLFANQQLTITDRSTRGEFFVSSVERLPSPAFADGAATFRCCSPITVSRPTMNNGNLSADYLSPDDPDFAPFMMENLVRRYATAQNKISSMAQAGHVEEALLDLPFDTQDWHLEVLSRPRSRLQVIKANTPQQTKVRGYDFRFRLKAAPELLQFGYKAGFGEKGSLGFGCVEIDNNQ